MKNYTIYLRQLVRWAIILLVIWFIWHLGKNWMRPFIIEQLGGYTKKEVVTKIDTVSIKIDSIFPVKKEREIVLKYIPKPIYTNPSDSTSKGSLNQQLDTINANHVYNTAISDSLIDGNIKTTISFKDRKLLSQSLKYTPKFPIFIEKTITVEKTNIETLSNKPRAKIGIGISGSSNVSGGGMLVYQTPKNLQIQAGYNFTKENLNESFKNKQGYITVSIIKLF